ncbi:EamA family transporter [Patescibacteria group bacterium]
MGFILAFVVAITESIKNIYLKKRTLSSSPVYTTWAWQVTSLLVFLPIILYTGIPQVSSDYWVIVGLKVIAMTVALVLYNKSLKETDVSLALPMLALTPLVTAVLSFFLIGDLPTLMGGIGIVVTIFGVYLLNRSRGDGLLAPFKEVYKNKGVFYMFLVSIIWGITTSFDKIAILRSTPIYYAVVTTVLTALFLTPIVAHVHKNEIKEVFSINKLIYMIPIGLLEGIVVFGQFTAYQFTLAAYIIAIKRTSIVFSSILAYFIFKEEIKDRLLPILIMVIGLMLILFA